MNEKLKKNIKKVRQETSLYKCGCGKKYSTFPSFLTHCKDKHQRKARGPYPKGSIVPKKQYCTRGRPKAPEINENIIIDFGSQYSGDELFLQENDGLTTLNYKDFLRNHCDEIQLRSMQFECIDDILIFLTELDKDYCIAKVGEKRVNIQEIWENSKEIQQLAPDLFADDLEKDSIEFIFQEFLRIVSVDLKAEIIKELLLFFAVLCSYSYKIGQFKLIKLQEFPNLEWKRWKEQNKELLKNCQIVGKQTYDMYNENVEFLVHFFIKYLKEAGLIAS